MTELRPAASLAAAAGNRPPSLRPLLVKGSVGLILGAGMTILAVIWSHGTLGFVSLMTVLGSLCWLGIGLTRHLAARFRRP